MEKNPAESQLPDGIIRDIDTSTISTDGYVAVPASVLAGRKFLIRDIMPNDYRFIVKGSTPIDKESGRIAIDTNDSVLTEGITKLSELEYRLPAMRILYAIGERSVTGFVIDFRRVREPFFDNLGLAEGTASVVFSERQELHGTELPIGVLFTDLDRTHYHGAAEGRGPALWLAQQVDMLVQTLRQEEQDAVAQQSTDLTA